MKELTVYSKRYGIITAIVDNNVFDKIHSFNWNVSQDKGNFYLFARGIFPEDKLRKVKLHQLIMMPYDSKGFVIDHKDGNTLNNTKENLRLATRQQNSQNRKPQKNKKSTYKGVTFFYKKWTVTITTSGKKIHGGSFSDEVEAAKRWNELARQYHGEFAYQNPV